jgi:hypothetical protein
MAKFVTEDESAMTKKQLLAYLKKKNDWMLYGRSEAMYKGTIRSAVRKVWMISKGRNDAFIASRTANTGSGAHKWYETCNMCGIKHRIGAKEYKVKKDGSNSKKMMPCLIAHHIIPCDDVFHPTFMRDMFCDDYPEPRMGLSILCHPCHKLAHIKLEEMINGA